MTHLLLVGCGKMGGALLSGWQSADLQDLQCTVIDPNVTHDSNDVTYHTSLDDLPSDYTPDIIVFAVKPSQLDDVLTDIQKRFSDDSIIYATIAAGKPVAYYQKYLGSNSYVIRIMPNTPVLVGKGMSILCASGNTPDDKQTVIYQLMQSVGHTVRLHDESLMDAATAISGSGPAYFFYFLECLVNAATQSGLDPNLANELALQTMIGAGELAAQSPDTFDMLRQNVTSPGGTTEAALHVFMQENALKQLTHNAIDAAKERGKKL